MLKQLSSLHPRKGLLTLCAMLATAPAALVQPAYADSITVVGVTSNLKWNTGDPVYTDAEISLASGDHFGQSLDTSSLTMSVVSANPSVATAAMDGGNLNVTAMGPGTAEIVITGSDANLLHSGLQLQDRIKAVFTKLGDTDGDGFITSADALRIYKSVNVTLTPAEINVLDINRDGFVTTADATLLMSRYVGKGNSGGTPLVANFTDEPDVPVAYNPIITGTVQSGSVVAGSYQYADAEGDQQSNSTYQWYRGRLQDGSDRVRIDGATDSHYQIQDQEVGYYLFFEVTPAADGGVGKSVVSVASAIVPDTTAPTYTSLSPANNNMQADSSGALTLTFSEKVFPVSGKKIVLRKSGSPSVIVATYMADDAAVAVQNNIVTIANPGLEADTGYEVEIDNGAFQDAAGNPFDGLTGSSLWSFKTKDTIAPILTGSLPVNHEPKADKSAPLSLTFSEDVTAASGKSIKIYRSADSVAVATYSADDVRYITVSGKTVTIANPGLEENHSYYVEIDAGAFKDLSGNDFTGIAGSGAWSFTAADQTAPVVTGKLPQDDAVGVDTTTPITLTFNEHVVPVSGKTIKVIDTATSNPVASYSADDASKVTISGNTVTITNPGLASAKEYAVIIEAGAFTDDAGNAFAGIADSSAWSFTTPDTAPPAISSLLPANAATNISAAGSLSIAFSEKVKPVGGKKIEIVKASDSSVAASVAVDDSSVSIAGNTVTVPYTGLDSLASYYVTIENGALTDTAGNPFAGIAANAWSFTTADSRTLTAQPDNPLTEGSLANAPMITLTISGDSFKDTFSSADVHLNNAPPGVSVSGLCGLIDDHTAYIVLDSDNTDFDSDYQMSVTVDGSGLASGQSLTTSPLQVTATQEVSAYISDFNVAYDPESQLQQNYAIQLATHGGANFDGYSLDVYQYDNTQGKMHLTWSLPMINGVVSNPYIIIDSVFYGFMDLVNSNTFYTGYAYFNDDGTQGYPSGENLYNPNLTLNALVLKKDGKVVDVLGDPNATTSKPIVSGLGTLVRKTGVVGGSGVYDPNQWDTFSGTYVANLGHHNE